MIWEVGGKICWLLTSTETPDSKMSGILQGGVQIKL